jgi:glycosyltransferase involved in cell wall biosynthesis
MRIAYISDALIPSRSANSIHIMKMCQAFARNGHEVVLLAPDLKHLYEPDVTDIYGYYGVDNCFELKKLTYPNIPGKSIYYAFTLSYEIKKIKPDLAYGRFLFGCFFAVLQGYPVVFESHIPIWENNYLKKFVFKKLISNTNFIKVVVISHSLKRMYLEKGYMNDSSIQVAHDCADEVADFEALAHWPGRRGALQVGYMGHLYPGRGVELIVELARRMKDIDFHLVGGTDDDIQCWKSQSVNNNLFFHGHVPPNVVHKYRNSCDILVAPYQKKCAISGGWGNTVDFMSPLKIFEYMSNKRPIIASDLPAVREILDEGNSLLVPSEDVDSWEHAICKLRDKALRDRLSENAYREFKNKYQWTARAKWVLTMPSCLKKKSFNLF